MSLILDLIFPKTCLGCGQKHLYFCSNCLSRQTRNSIQYLSKKPNLEGILNIFKYNSIIKQGIVELKYNFVTDLIDELTTISALEIEKNFPHLLEYWHQNNFVLVPIPLHSYRQNWRGFNQSVLLGQSLSQKLKLDFSQDFLIRVKNTHPQAKFINKSQRKSNLENAFSYVGTPPQNIILFDDVCTTRSTFNSALKTLNFSAQIHCWYLSLAG